MLLFHWGRLIRAQSSNFDLLSNHDLLLLGKFGIVTLVCSVEKRSFEKDLLSGFLLGDRPNECLVTWHYLRQLFWTWKGLTLEARQNIGWDLTTIMTVTIGTRSRYYFLFFLSLPDLKFLQELFDSLAANDLRRIHDVLARRILIDLHFDFESNPGSQLAHFVQLKNLDLSWAFGFETVDNLLKVRIVLL